MTTYRDTDRMLDAWLAEGFNVANDRVLDVVEDRISHQRQSPAWRVSWRDTHVNAYFKLAAGLAAVLVAGFVGWQLLPSTGGIGGTPTPPPSAAPSATEQPQPSPTFGSGTLPNGTLAAGHYTIALPTDQFPGMTISADVPAGWKGYPEIPALTSPSDSESGKVGGLIGFMAVKGLFSDACHWDLDGTGLTDQPGNVEVGSTVDDVVAAVTANKSYTASAPSPVTIGGFQGKVLDLQLPGNDVLTKCDGQAGQPGDYKFIPLESGFWAQGPDSRWRLFILDVGGTRLITMISSFGSIPQAELDAAQAIVESFEITP
jgi:hypothetical protein